MTAHAACQCPPGPSEREEAAPSGRLLLRMPGTLHGALAELAEREGTSLNQFITAAREHDRLGDGEQDSGRSGVRAG